MKKTLLFMSALAFIATSCQKDVDAQKMNIEKDGITINASYGNDTRVVIGDIDNKKDKATTYWSANDAIGVFNYSDSVQVSDLLDRFGQLFTPMLSQGADKSSVGNLKFSLMVTNNYFALNEGAGTKNGTFYGHLANANTRNDSYYAYYPFSESKFLPEYIGSLDTDIHALAHEFLGFDLSVPMMAAIDTRMIRKVAPEMVAEEFARKQSSKTIISVLEIPARQSGKDLGVMLANCENKPVEELAFAFKAVAPIMKFNVSTELENKTLSNIEFMYISLSRDKYNTLKESAISNVEFADGGEKLVVDNADFIGIKNDIPLDTLYCSGLYATMMSGKDKMSYCMGELQAMYLPIFRMIEQNAPKDIMNEVNMFVGKNIIVDCNDTPIGKEAQSFYMTIPSIYARALNGNPDVMKFGVWTLNFTDGTKKNVIIGGKDLTGGNLYSMSVDIRNKE